MNCMIAGVGGQGTVLASKLVALAAMKRGLQVRTAETIGMAQRGGSVVSHIRMGERICSPLVPLGRADLILAFELAEGARLLPYLSPQGAMILCDSCIKPVTSSLAGGNYDCEALLRYLENSGKEILKIKGEKLLARCENAKTLNVALLGAALASGRLPFGVSDMEDVIRDTVPQRFIAMNLKALAAGMDTYQTENGEG